MNEKAIPLHIMLQGDFSVKIRRKYQILATLCVFLFVGVSMLSGVLVTAVRVREEPVLSENLPQFRNFTVSAERFQGCEAWGEDDYKQLAQDFLYYNGQIKKGDKQMARFSWYALFMPEEKVKPYAGAFQTVLSDVRCFPVAEDPEGQETVHFEDSWCMSRSYGGNRVHEGTDIMPSNKERGYFPVVSVCDGKVEKKGWLNLGGYRLGIRSEAGAYFYYAHLESYAEGVKEGTAVKAGQVIGYMGDSGYGEEGTVGKFDVHLHFGIYLDLEGKEVSVNPYEVLRSVEKKKVSV